MNSTATLVISESGRAVQRARAHERKQKDELCGAFCAAVAIEAISGAHISQDAIAAAAATVLSGGGDPGYHQERPRESTTWVSFRSLKTRRRPAPRRQA